MEYYADVVSVHHRAKVIISRGPHSMTSLAITDETFSKKLPLATLIVDLDGTLTPANTLHESIILLIKKSPWNLLRLPLGLLRDRGRCTYSPASHVSISAENLPYCESLLAFLRREKERGRRIILAAAVDKLIVEGISMHLGVFDEVLATDAGYGANSREKLAAIQEMVGGEFVYAGDSRADIPIWNASKSAILVGASSRVAAFVRRKIPIEHEFAHEGASVGIWLRAIRVHQWLKNLLLFVPMVTAFSFLEFENLATMSIAFFAFSLAASATYIVNDLWDLENDRAHPRKRYRPFAIARISVLQGIIAAAGCLVFAFVLALAVSWPFVLMLLLYLALTTTYSWVLKSYVLIDVIMLSLLYTLRILAGAVAIEIATSSWLLAFSVFMFLSLALVKRCSELVSLGQVGKEATTGRDYRVTDLVVLWPLGVGAALSAVVIFGLFISAPETQVRYATPQLLWLVAIGLIYWLARLWIKTARGAMHDDPVVYAIKDRASCITIIAMLATMLAAHFFAASDFF